MKGKEGFNELDFIDKENSQRFQFFPWCDIESLSNYFSKSMKSGKTAFQIPHEIEQAAGGVPTYRSHQSGDPEQMYLTVRSSQRGKTTFSTSLSLWNERPRLVFCIEKEQDQDQDVKKQSMHLLEEQGVILYARKGDLKFHSMEEPYIQ